MQHASDKDHYFNDVLTKQPAVDLLIVDVLEGLVVPTVSIPASSIPQWNAFSEKGLQDVFDFGENYLYDRGAFLILYPYNRHILSYILGFCVRVVQGRSKSRFSFYPVPSLEPSRINVGENDMLRKSCNEVDMTINGTIHWCGLREKSPELMHILVEATTSIGDVVMDCTTSTS